MADGSAPVIPAVRLVAPTLGDYAYVAHRMRADERAQFVAMASTGRYDPDACARAAAAMTGPQFALVDRAGFPLLIGGFEPLRPGVYEGWQMAVDGAWERHAARFHRASVRLMDNLFAGGAHRIQTCALTSRTAAHAWYARIGMVNEGVQAGYCTDGQDAVMFARTVRKPR